MKNDKIFKLQDGGKKLLFSNIFLYNKQAVEMNIDYISDNIDIRFNLCLSLSDLYLFIQKDISKETLMLGNHSNFLSFEYDSYSNLIRKNRDKGILPNEMIVKISAKFYFRLEEERISFDYFVIQKEELEKLKEFFKKTISQEKKQVINHFRTKNIAKILQENDLNKKLIVVDSLGKDADNQIEFDYAYNLLLKLAYFENSKIKVAVIKSLSLIIQKGYGFDVETLKKTIQNSLNSCEESDKILIKPIIQELNENYKFNIKI